MYKLLTASAVSASGVLGERAAPSSLLQISNSAPNAEADRFVNSMRAQVDDFKKKMDAEVSADQEQLRQLKEQERKMDREEKAFKAKVFAHTNRPKASFMESSSHFGDPYIDEAMRVLGDEIDSQKRDLERVLASRGRASESLIEEKAKRPELGLIAAALKTRLAMVDRN